MSIILSAARIPYQDEDVGSEQSYDADELYYPEECGSEASFDPEELLLDVEDELCLLFKELRL
jgi:hypothetical protein